MSKFSRNQKIEIYEKRKQRFTLSSLSKEDSVGIHNLCYLIKCIYKVLIDNQSALGIAIEYDLDSDCILFNWIKSYRDNGFVIVEKSKIRQSTIIKKY